MKVYVVVDYRNWDCDGVIGVYGTLAEAKDAVYNTFDSDMPLREDRQRRWIRLMGEETPDRRESSLVRYWVYERESYLLSNSPVKRDTLTEQITIEEHEITSVTQ